MTISERERLGLFDQLKTHLGTTHAGTMMELLPPTSWDELATKDDLALTRSELRTEMGEVRTEMAELKTELRTEIAEVRTEMAELKTELRTEMAGFRSEVTADLAGLRAEFHSAISAQTRLLMVSFAGFAETIWVSLLIG